MFIKSLRLRNFKAIKEADLSFRKGVICFTGNNGEGKSTVLHALMLLLFGTTYEGTLKDSIRWGEKEFSISMEFEHERKSYMESLTYSLTKGSDKVLVCHDTDEEFRGASATSKLAEIIDPEQARASMVSMENEQNLVTTTPSQRREYLKKIYSLEFKEELNKIAQDLTDLDSEILELQGKRGVLSEMSYPLKEERELPDAEEYSRAVKEIDNIDARLKELFTERDKLDKLRKELSDADASIAKIERQLRDLDSDVDYRRRENEAIREELDKLNSIDYDALEAQEIESEARKHEDSRKDLQLRIDIDEKELDSIPSVVERVSRSKLEELNSRKGELSHAIRESTEKLAVLSKGKCPTCGRDIDPEEAEKERERLSGLREEEAGIISQYEAEQKRIDAQMVKNEEIRSTLNRCNDQLTKHRHDLDMLDASFESLKSNIALKYKAHKSKQEGDIKALTAKREMNENYMGGVESMKSMYREQLEELTSRKENLSAQEAEYDNIYEFIELLKAKREEPQRIIREMTDAVDYNNSIKAYNEEMMKRESERESSLREVESSLENLNARKTMISIAKGIVQREFPSFVISRMVQSLSDYVNEFLEKVYPKYRITIEESKNSLNILYGDYRTDVKMASGFEKSAFSLAYMYALGKIQAYGLLICDEGDATASDENSAKFYRMLGRSTDWLEQIMCITHKEEIKELLKNDFRAQVFMVENGEYKEEIA